MSRAGLLRHFSQFRYSLLFWITKTRFTYSISLSYLTSVIAAETPVKYERDWKDWRGTFAKPKYHWRNNWRPEFWYPNQKAGKAPGMIELQNHAFRSTDFSKLLKQFVTATFFVPKVSLVVKNLADQRIRRLWRISTQSCFFECKVYKAVHHWGHFSGRWWPFSCHDRTFDPRQIFIQSFNRHRSK